MLSMDTEHPDLDSFRQIRLDEIRRLHHTQNRDVSVASSSTMRAMTSTHSESTERGTPEGSWAQDYFDDYLPESEAMDIDPQEGDGRPTVDSNQIQFVVATDFGTTFSSVAFTRRFQGAWEPPQSVSRYPHDPFILNGKESYEVPTQSCYPDIAMVKDHIDESTSVSETGEEIKDIFEDDDEIEEPYAHIYHRESGDDREDSVGDEDHDIIIAEPDHTLDEQNSLPFYHWGYQIQDLMRSDTLKLSEFQHLERFKLILDQGNGTKTVRDTLKPILTRLKRWGMIKEDHDVIADYLTKLFIHTKEQIRAGDDDFNDNCPIEHVLCVPNAWSSKACRTMQKAMESAIRRSGFGTLDNLFIITEPEAAATYVLHENSRISVYDGETFIILDAGGGTVDITTYTVIGNHPLRLREALDPKGALCGSSYLNENFRAHLLERLKMEAYLEHDGITIEGIADEAMIEFENKWKRTVDFGDRRNPKHQVPGWSVRIPGLREDRRKRFIENHLLIEHNDLHGIFQPLLSQIGELMEEQIYNARNVNLFVKKVILVGGFAGSPSLRGYLRRKLNIVSRQLGSVTELVSPQFSYDTAVSLGAVRRALHKENGPQRRTKSSFGFVRTDLYDKKNIPAHVGVRPKIDPLDGRKYIRNTIDWLVQQGDTIPPYKEYSLEVEHTFALYRTKLLCEEILYVSDKRGESHYRIRHSKNKEAEEAGRIIADMTFLLTNGLIEPSEPEEGFKGKRHYKVQFELVMIVEGRNLRFEARYPVGGEVIAGKRFCIAAAFEPGTN